jgi:hypothetical protein
MVADIVPRRWVRLDRAAIPFTPKICRLACGWWTAMTFTMNLGAGCLGA